MNNNTKPVIFLAFANDRGGGIGYLRNLPEEARQVQAALDAAAQAGLCEVVVHQNVTVGTVLDVFQDARYRNRIAIFHYGGHAESYELLLETAEGKTATADAGGLAAFLSRQTGLQLVFLNGCSTQPQVQGLLDAGVAAVIATAQAIDDAVATDFAVRFYKGLAGGGTVGTAFHEAEAAARTVRGGQVRSVYVKQAVASPAGEAMADRWPWALTCRPGSELVRDWNLPDAANDPLFGLPPLPALDLPREPFRNILWFRREDAPIFFGRGYAIRELFQRVTALDAAPVVLYYGQSGVGKSSLLAAGLLPRLEPMQTVVYARRDQALGLEGTLTANLPGSSEASGKVPAADLLAAWRGAEADSGKPLTVILDQAEEVYTRPNEALPGEMADFLDVLAGLFGDPATRPQGKLIIGFRKEWLAEIEKLAAERQIQHAKVFLQRLDRRGIVEAVSGPAKSERLRQQYGLTVEDGLAEEIADDLLADPSSAVAPTLQILLSKLWKQARERDRDHPHLDRNLYHDLRRQGLLLGDFLNQQMAALRSTQSAAVDSGLALDLLAFHTTPLGTAEQRTLAELRATYAHQAMTLDGLLGACRDLYLLVDPAENRPDAEPASRLAHDTLAPLIRQRFEESDAPGQRARRILESRGVDWEDGKEGAPLDDADLMLVAAGKEGMRTWQPDENRLMKASLAAQAQRKAERERQYQERLEAAKREQAEREARAAADARAEQEQKNAGKLRQRAVWLALALVVALVLAGVAGFLFYDANAARTNVAQLNRAVQAQRLAAEGVRVVEERPQLALLLAVEGARQQLDKGETVIESVQDDLRVLLDQVGGIQLIRDEDLATAQLSPSGEWIAITHASTIELRKTAQPTVTEKSLAVAEGNITAIAFSPDSRLLAGASSDGGLRIWDLNHPGRSQSMQLCKHDDGIHQLTFTADGAWLLSADWEGHLCASPITLPNEMPTTLFVSGNLFPPMIAPYQQGSKFVTTRYQSDANEFTVEIWDPASPAQPEQILMAPWESDGLAVAPDGRWIASTIAGGEVVQLWDLADPDGHEPIDLYPQSCREFVGSYAGTAPLRTHQIQFSPDSQRLAASGVGGPDTAVQVWNLAASTSEIETYPLCGVNNISELAYSPDGSLLVTAGADASVRLWKENLREPFQILRGHESWVTSLHFDQNGRHLLTASQDHTVRLWDLVSPDASSIVIETPHGTGVNSVRFSSDGAWLVSSGGGNNVAIYNMENPAQPPDQIEVLASSMAFANQSNRLAIGEDTGAVTLWDLDRLQRAETLLPGSHPSGSDGITVLAFSATDRWLATFDEADGTTREDDTLTLWDLASTPVISHALMIPSTYTISALAFSKDERRLFAASKEGWFGENAVPFDPASSDPVPFEYALLTWDVAQPGKPAQRDLLMKDKVSRVNAVGFSADGASLVLNASDGVYYFDLDDLQREPTKSTWLQTGNAAAFSGDNRWLVIAGDGIQTVERDKISAGKPLTIRPNARWVNDVAISPDGQWIAGAWTDGTVRLFMVDFDQILAIACLTAGRNMSAEEWQAYLPDDPRETCSQWIAANK